MPYEHNRKSGYYGNPTIAHRTPPLSNFSQNRIFLSIAGGLDLLVVDLHAIIQVQLNAAQGEVADHLVIFPALLELFLELFLPFGGSSHFTGVCAVVDHVLHTANLGLIDPLHLVEVVHSKIADGVRRVAVEINQSLEAVLLAAVEQPVDRALLINFAVVFEKILEEIITDNLTAAVSSAADGFGNEVQIFFQRIFPINRFQPAAQAGDNIVPQILFIRNGQNAVCVREEGLVFALIPVPTGIGQTLHVQRIAAKHTATA